MNRINSFTDRAARDIVSVTRKIKRTIPLLSGQRRRVFSGKAAIYSFTLLEDAVAGMPFGSAKARIDTIDGAALVIDVATLRYKWAVLDGAKAGYQGDCTQFGNAFYFTQGPCVVKCPSNATFTAIGPTTGTVGDAFTGLAEADNADAGSFGASGLPDGLSIDADGNITGTPTKAGKFWVAFSVIGRRSDGQPGSCPSTKLVLITIGAT